MFSDLSALASSVFQVLTDIFNLYTGSILLCGVLVLWLLRRIVKFFQYL